MRDAEWVCRTAWDRLAKGWTLSEAARAVRVKAADLDAMIWHWRAEKTASRG